MYYGVMQDINPNTGLPVKNLHADVEPNRIGKILKTTLDKINRKITFIAEVANTPNFPDIVSKIKAGWGVSIGGFVTKANWFVDAVKGLCMKIKNLTVEHVQLIDPTVVRGQDAAKVEDVAVQECMIMDVPLPKLSLGKVTIGKGIKSVSISIRETTPLSAIAPPIPLDNATLPISPKKEEAFGIPIGNTIIGLIEAEIAAIEQYTQALTVEELAEFKKEITEILNDEKDHKEVLSKMLYKILSKR
jgi:hypothetical protein